MSRATKQKLRMDCGEWGNPGIRAGLDFLAKNGLAPDRHGQLASRSPHSRPNCLCLLEPPNLTIGAERDERKHIARDFKEEMRRMLDICRACNALSWGQGVAAQKAGEGGKKPNDVNAFSPKVSWGKSQLPANN